MTRTIRRRDFIRTGAAAGLALAAGGSLTAGPRGGAGGGRPRVGVGAGDDFEQAAIRAIELAGGIKRFVPKGAKVALLPNVQSPHPGTFTRSEIVRAVIRLCRKAGASEINCLSWQTEKQWQDTGLKAVLEAEGAGLRIFAKDESLFRPAPVPKGVLPKETRILAALYDHQVLINMPITKDHIGTHFTGTMKNLMGLNSPASNRTFHRPHWTTDPEDTAYLEQSIVDLNKAVRPALNVVDATEFIVSNGPFGPGMLMRAHKVVAGTDRVAIDAYCASLWGLKPQDIVQIKRGSEQGLGQINLDKVDLREENI
jgi:uncharacterized protein (DUF362 family)